MKTIVITPEWILSKLISYRCDGEGNACFFTNTLNDRAWAHAALGTLGIDYETFGNDTGGDVYENLVSLMWGFKIDDIKDLKVLYERLRKEDEVERINREKS